MARSVMGHVEEKAANASKVVRELTSPYQNKTMFRKQKSWTRPV